MKRNVLVLLMLVVPAFAAGSMAAAVPFDLDSGRPMVQLTVNGKGPYPFVFDTGSPVLLIMQSLADELQLEVVGKDSVGSPMGGAPIETDVVRVASVALGEATVGDLEVRVLPMDGHGLGKGVVGPAVFREHGAMTLDFKRNMITLGASVPEQVTWLPFGDSAPLLDVPVRIGDVEFTGHIDTGSPGALTVPEAVQDRLPLSGPVRTVGRGRSVNAEFEIRAAPMKGTAFIGDATLPLERVQFTQAPFANLGSAGLRGLVLHIDWAKERFALSGTAAPSPATPPGVRRIVRGGPGAASGPRRVAGGDGPKFGIIAIPSPDGTIRVTGTEPGSPAEALGLQNGDKIIAVNGKSMGDLGFGQVRTELAREDVELTVERDGETLRLKRAVRSGS